MLHSRVEKQSFVAPLALSIAALTILSASSAFGLRAGSVVAQLLLFIAPMAFGIRGALIVCAVAIVPWLVNTDQLQTGVRITILLLTLGCAQRYAQAIPAYIITLGAWLLMVHPALDAMTAFMPSLPAIPPEQAIFDLIQDVFVTSLAGSLLFNQTVWWGLTARIRYLSPHQLIPHLMTTSVLASLFVFALVLRQVGLLDDASQTSVGVALGSTIVSAFVLVPTLCGFHISRFIGSTSASPLLAGGLAHNDTAPRDGVSLGKMQDDTWNIIAGVVAGGQAQNGAPASTNALDSGVCAVDEAGLVLFMNDRFKALALIEDITPVGNPLGKVASSSDLIKYIAQLVASTDPTADFVEEIRVSGRQDKAKFLEIHLMPHDGQSGSHEESQEMTGSPRVIRLTDITAKRTIDERLSRIQRNKALSACARSAAPHLSELFTSILGRASHALHVGQPSAFAGALQSIQILAGQGGNIVQQLNELTIPPEAATRRTVNLKTTIQERLAILQGLVGEKIEIQIQATSGELNARVDTALLTQAITLVVMNAAEAYPDGAGRVSISMGPEEIDELVCKLHPGSRPGNFCRISISDYGRGMSPEVLARVANPLLTQRGEFGHIGLDLPSVLAVMSDHDGFMTVESKPDRGTTVSLYFPVAKMSPQIDQPAEARNGAHRQATSANHDSTRVLIVEDRPELRALLQEMVKSLGYRSTTCSSKDDALKLMQAAPVDILLVEEALPGLSAHELVTEAHARDSHVKTVLLSSSQNKADEESDAVLVKPFDLQTLAKTLEESEMSLH